MGVSSYVHSWWEEWQMRVLVLSSLVVQVILLSSSLVRRRGDMPRPLRYLMRLAFMVSDPLVIYAIATLFDRHKADGGGRRGGSSTLEVVWAPVLLAHLGGLHSISAWKIEDSEKWSGYLLTAVYQVALAIYVFCKSWPPDGHKKLLNAAILLFVYGGLKCFEKPWTVKRSSFTDIARSVPSGLIREDDGEMDVPGYVKDVMGIVRAYDHQRAAVEEEEWWEQRVNEDEAYRLFVDLSSFSYGRRISILRSFWGLSEARAYGCLREELSGAFLIFYTTRLKLKGIPLARFIFLQPAALSRMVLLWVAIALFHQSRGEAYNDIDVKITYALLCCTAVLETCSTLGVPVISAKRSGDDDFMRSTEWPHKVAQHSLMAYFARNKNHSSWMWIVGVLGFKDLLDQKWTTMSPCSSAAELTSLVLRYLIAGWKEKIHDAASYRRFNDNRGHWALEGHNHLRWSINGQFDETVLIWHLATDFCYFKSHQAISPRRENRPKAVRCRDRCREISNYMMYLLFFNPEMLLPGTRRHLFTGAYYELKDILRDEKKNPLSWSLCREDMLIPRLITILSKSNKSKVDDHREESFIHSAWALAQGLLELRHESGEEKTWEVIQGVWVEMLCFSASRCRGYLHAKALGSGGEFLSYIWLLLFHMGMETFTDRLHGRSEEPASCNNSPPRASDAHSGNATTSSTSEVHITVSSSAEDRIISEE